MKSKMDTVVYELKEGNKIVYIGTTNDTDTREAQHVNDGKKFTKMVISSKKMTEKGAVKKEEERLAKYRKSHKGNNPKYNDKLNG